MSTYLKITPAIAKAIKKIYQAKQLLQKEGVWDSLEQLGDFAPIKIVRDLESIIQNMIIEDSYKDQAIEHLTVRLKEEQNKAPHHQGSIKDIYSVVLGQLQNVMDQKIGTSVYSQRADDFKVEQKSEQPEEAK